MSSPSPAAEPVRMSGYEVKNQKLTIKQSFKQRPPSDTAASCNLKKNPNENKQFEVTI